MPQAVTCPECDADLLVPSNAESSAWLRCPSCRAVFQLQSAAVKPLAEAVLVGPTAVPIDSGGPAEPFAAAADFARRPAGEAQLPTGEQSDELVEERSELTLADLMPPAEPAGEPPPYSPPRANLGATDESALGESPSVGDADLELDDLDLEPLGPQEPLEAPKSPAESLANAGWSEGADRLEDVLARVDRQAAVDTPADDLPLADEPIVEPRPAPPTFVPRRKRSAVRRLAGAALGGILGLVAGYYLLLVIGGPGADALELAEYVPSTLLPDSFRTESASPADAPISPAPPATEQVAAAPSREESAEVPASFETPAVPTSPTPSDDDRYASDRATDEAAQPESPSEPRPLDESAAIPLQAVEPDVTDAPSFTVDQLRGALDAARQAQPGLVAGDLSDAAMRRTKGLSYAGMCELANVLTFVGDPVQDDDAASLEHEAEQLFRETLADERIRAEVAEIAPIWVRSPHRRHGGVFLAGTVVGRSVLGEVNECQFDTGQGTTITLLVPNRMADALNPGGQPLGIVGAIIDRPSERVTGYTGGAPQAVWVRSILRIP